MYLNPGIKPNYYNNNFKKINVNPLFAKFLNIFNEKFA